MISEEICKSYIELRDLELYNQTSKNLKRYYYLSEYPDKQRYVIEYYKYYEDVPRIFMDKISNVIHNFYDKKRKINYIKI